jgi:hypothetical protein
LKKTLFIFLLLISVPFAFWGWAYEFAFFAAYSANVHNFLKLEHYFLTGFMNLIPWLFLLACFSLLLKFFSSSVQKDELSAFKIAAQATNFLTQLSIARMVFCLSLVFLLLTIADFKYGFKVGLGRTYLLMVFFNLQAFAITIFLSPSQSKAAVSFAFIVSMAFCYAAGGVSRADDSQNSKTLRDDHIVKIVKLEKGFSITPRQLLPLDFSGFKVKDFFKWFL